MSKIGVKSPFKTKSDPKTLTAFYAAYDDETIKQHLSVKQRMARLKGLPRRVALYFQGEDTFTATRRIEPRV